MITQKRLKELFIYSRNGYLLRRIGIKGSARGSIIGSVREKGYMVAMVDGRYYRVHHLIWMFHYGKFAPELDHKNRNRADNRIKNLRVCNHSQNLGNSGPRVHKYKGVTLCKQTGRWRAQLNGHLGRFDTIEEAALVYNAAAKKHFGKFALLNKVSQ